ncbi:hypothetical protein OEZ85_012211 [Tetradesmus obliquus]|uniref:Right handed beta helix domain-containing protein n=1 Tax=Tetradesmus obliquus TaxID=3088 RepID=A0ABY8TXE5_TETOB|nr:hypothetical protein OEZ85_012211 [Tetradesmus obliquus]
MEQRPNERRPGLSTCHGHSQNASSIQAALDAAAPGTIVTIPAGRYIVREPLIVRKNNITIFARRGAVLDCLNASKPLNSTKPALIVRADSFKRPTMCPEGPKQQFPLKNFTLRGTLQVRNASETAIYIFGVDGFRVSGTSVIDAGKHALASECSKNGAFRNNYARQGIGIMVMGSQRVNVTRNRIENHSQGGVFHADHDYGLHFVDIKDDPALINKAATNTTITNNRFSNNGYAPVNCCSMWSHDLYNDFVDFALWGKGTCFSGNSYTSAAVMYPPDFPEQARFMPDVQHYRASEFDSFQSYATACK